MEDKKRLAWFILLRVVVVSIFLVSTIILNAREPGSLGGETLSGVFRLILATYFFSIISLAILWFTKKFQQIFTYAQLIWDLLLITLLILLTGGINSPFSFLYVLSIINASVLLARREAVYTASLCAILYGAILDFQFYGKLAFLGLNSLPGQQYGTNFVFYTIFINILAFYLVAFLTGYLAERARRSEDALHEKEIDYEELERLNSSIVSNLGSGLLTLNSEGKIRVFNRYATELTGITQEEAYDMFLSEVIPGLSLLKFDAKPPVRREEIEYRSRFGERKLLGYKFAPLLDKEGNRAGDIVSLQDITRLKTMEAELKKADRLAAIGSLSARIAHEIRNPLASISGSVQLIAQGNSIEPNDKKLLEIVLRETDRLNALTTDFLAYARPNPPVKMPVYLKLLMNDLMALLPTDPRFEKVLVSHGFHDETVVAVDPDQFRQVLWNLFVNAAEAMPSGGEIRVEAAVVTGDEMDGVRDIVKILFTDTGKGIAKENIKHIFEPFFTTKSGGTGLGLATVHSIITSHAGSIQVESSEKVGTTFNICLPVD